MAIPRQSGHGTSNFKIIFQTQMWYQMKAKSLNFMNLNKLSNFKQSVRQNNRLINYANYM